MLKTKCKILRARILKLEKGGIITKHHDRQGNYGLNKEQKVRLQSLSNKCNIIYLIEGYIDIVNYNHSLNIGTIGMKGSRAGNFALQNCDYLVILGCSLNNTHIGYDPDLFANKAYKIMIDIDDNESKKGFVNLNEFYNCDISSIF